jgi:hypothetical protein
MYQTINPGLGQEPDVLKLIYKAYNPGLGQGVQRLLCRCDLAA